MPHCAAFGCNFQSKGNKGSDVSLHSFPSDKKKRKEWEIACGRLKLPKYPRLCSRHFSPDAFESFCRPQLLKELTGVAGYKRRLKTNAVPTIFAHRKTKCTVNGNRFIKPKIPENLDAQLVGREQPASTVLISESQLNQPETDDTPHNSVHQSALGAGKFDGQGLELWEINDRTLEMNEPLPGQPAEKREPTDGCTEGRNPVTKTNQRGDTTPIAAAEQAATSEREDDTDDDTDEEVTLENLMPNYERTGDLQEADSLSGEGQPLSDWLEPLDEDMEDVLDPEYDMRDGRPQTVGSARKQRRRWTKKQSSLDDGWTDCPILGEGWKRKEVFRRSGFSIGKTDTYYISPSGERIRSKIEMLKHLEPNKDLTFFDFRSGEFVDNKNKRRKKRRKKRTAYSSVETVSSGSSDNLDSEPQNPLRATRPPHSPVFNSSPPKLGDSPLVATPPKVGDSLDVATMSQHRESSQILTHCQSTRNNPLTPPQVDTAPDAIVPQAGVIPPQTLSDVVTTQLRDSPARFVKFSVSNNASPSSLTPCAPCQPVTTSSLSIHKVLTNDSLTSSSFFPPRAMVPLMSSENPSLPHKTPQVPHTTQIPLSSSSSSEMDYDAELQDCFSASKHSSLCSPLSVAYSPLKDKTALPDGLASLANTETPFCCIKCGTTFYDVGSGRKHYAMCLVCRSEGKLGNPKSLILRKQWLPCGECQACQEPEDCGSCTSCQHKRMKPRKTILCWKRKCLNPIHKEWPESHLQDHRTMDQGHWAEDKEERNLRPKKKAAKLWSYEKVKKRSLSQDSDSEDPGCDDDYSSQFSFGKNKDKKRSRRACRQCTACLRTTDCGKCDFCMDKPKFGGSNKKRQKCRMRQCQSHAMRHLLPFQMARCENIPSAGWVDVGKDKARELKQKKMSKKRPMEDSEVTEESLEEYAKALSGKEENRAYEMEVKKGSNQKAKLMPKRKCERHYELDPEKLYVSEQNFSVQNCTDMKTNSLEMGKESLQFPEGLYNVSQIQSTLDPTSFYKHTESSVPQMARNLTVPAEGQARMNLDEDVQMVRVGGLDGHNIPMITGIFSLASSQPQSNAERELLKLLEALRHTVLPPYWTGVLTRGPQLQLLQCSKLSTMVDTVVHIELDFYYQITVQEQPLLLTHPLYDSHPLRLTSVPEVVALLVDLETFTVCQGYPITLSHLGREPVLYVRAAACDLLVLRTEQRCEKCCLSSLRM